MKRPLAAVLAVALSLAGFAAVFAATSWVMHAASFLEISPRAGRVLALTISISTSLVISAVLVPLSVWKQRRNAEQVDQSGVPAPRLWLRSFQPPDE